MKLIDILVQELPKRGGWIEGHYQCAQDKSGEVCFYTEGKIHPTQYGLWSISVGSEARHDGFSRVAITLADDYAETIITREQYESALSASKPDWDGEGLPPVGCRVEVKADDFEGGWLVIDVVYVHNGEVVGIVLSENEYLNDRLEKFSAGYNRAEFRPIRSEEDRRRDATCDAMHKIWREVAGQTREDGSLIDIYSCIYDAIAAGKIPHIRID